MLNRQVALASPRTDHGINIKDVHAVQGILRYGRKLECSATFQQRLFFSPKCGINQAQDAERWAVIRLCANRFLLLRTRDSKGDLRSGCISFHPSYRTLQVSSAKLHSTPACTKSILAQRTQCRQRVISGDSVALVQSEIKAQARRFSVICENLFENSVHRSGIGSLLYVDPSTYQPVANVVWFEGDDAIKHFSALFVLAQ